MSKKDCSTKGIKYSTKGRSIVTAYLSACWLIKIFCFFEKISRYTRNDIVLSYRRLKEGDIFFYFYFRKDFSLHSKWHWVCFHFLFVISTIPILSGEEISFLFLFQKRFLPTLEMTLCRHIDDWKKEISFSISISEKISPYTRNDIWLSYRRLKEGDIFPILFQKRFLPTVEMTLGCHIDDW